MGYIFDPMENKRRLVEWIRDWFAKNGPDCKAVIGISGGKDSTIAAALCAEAIGKERVLGVMMPNGTQYDIQDSYKVVEALDIPYINVNIEHTVKSVQHSIHNASTKIKFNDQATFNLPPRVRMTTLYAVSQCVNGRVVNTCNLSETMLGWETRWGDAVGDFSPFANLTKTEVVEIGKIMRAIPMDLVIKAPGDGLCGKNDEDAFGFTYDMLDKHLRGVEIDPKMAEKMDKRIRANMFKHSPIPAYKPEM